MNRSKKSLIAYSSSQLFHRVVEALKDVVQQYKNEKVILVTHSGVMHHMYMFLNGTTDGIRIPNSCVSILEHSDHVGWSIKKWGSTEHLSTVGSLDLIDLFLSPDHSRNSHS